MYLFITINQYFATHPCGIIRSVGWALKTLYCRCNEITLTSRINYIGSTDRRPFECSNRELSLWCGALHWFGIWNSTRTPFRWFQSHPTRLDGDFCRWSESEGWNSCLACCVVSRAWGVSISSGRCIWSCTVGQDILHGRRLRCVGVLLSSGLWLWILRRVF